MACGSGVTMRHAKFSNLMIGRFESRQLLEPGDMGRYAK
jgi:hypothetical protein